MQPTAPHQRIEELDLIRGLALLGILVANLRGYAGPAAVYYRPELFWSTPPDRWAQFFVDFLVTSKFLTIFGVLFGVGAAIFAERWGQRGERPLGPWLRRMLALAGFGAAHAFLLWWGDILLPYAIAGLLLMPFLTLELDRILFWSLLCYWFPVFAMLGLSVVGNPSPAALAPSQPWTAVTSRYREESFWALVQVRAHEWLEFNSSWPFSLMRILGLFLFGVYAWRGGYVRLVFARRELARRCLTLGLLLGLPLNLLAAGLRSWAGIDPGSSELGAVLLWIANSLGVPFLSLAYAMGIVLLCRSRAATACCACLVAAGRMALTVYICQSALGAALFCGWGLGLYGKLAMLELLALAPAIFGVQLLLARWWLRHFRFGPLEWLWRYVTYGR